MVKLSRMYIIIILSVVLSFPAIAVAGKTIGKITRLKGRVAVYRSGAKIGLSAKNGMDLQQNDKIKTTAKAYLRFQLSDGSIMTLGEKAELTLDSFTYNPNKKKRVAFFQVALGRLRVFANQMLKYRDNRFQIKTPTAVAGVRGTVFMVWVESPTVTKIACFDSAVEVSSVFKPDEFVVLTKNILTSISKGKAPTQPVLMTEKMFQAFQGGFEGNIKAADEETGFKPKEEDSRHDEKREAPDPIGMDNEPIGVEPPELLEEGPVNELDGRPLQEQKPGELEQKFEPEPPEPVIPEPEPDLTLPSPPAVPI